MPKVERVCGQCGETFTTYRGQRCCSRECSNLARKGRPIASRNPPIERACEQCGKTYRTYPSQRPRFCSRACSHRAGSTGLRQGKPRRGDTIPCDVCGTSFYRGPGEIGTDRRFCSMACYGVFQRKPPVVKTCEQCGKVLSLKPSRAVARYCSKTCEIVARTRNFLDREHNGRPARLSQYGYILVWEPTHPNRTMKGWQFEHRLIVEAGLGRYLRSDEHVHHINGIKDDNRPENLEVMAAADHAALSARDWKDLILRERAELAAYRERFGPLLPEIET